MVIIANALDEDDDRTIWHYTNNAGFLGIISTHSIWASDLLFLNDSSEIYHAFNIIRKFMTHSEYDEVDRLLVDVTIDHAGGNQNGILSDSIQSGTFAISFSSKADDLNQWRGYSSGSGGYCIGFSTSKLRAWGEKQGFVLEKVLYQPDEQDQLIRPMVEELLSQSRKLSLSIESLKNIKGTWPWTNIGKDFPRLADNFINRLRSIAPILKHPSFAAEEEWRLVLVSRNTLDKPNTIEVRDTKTGLVPYVPLKISEQKSNTLELQHIYIGPSPRSHLNLLASTYAGQKNNVTCKSYQTSSLPFRDW